MKLRATTVSPLLHLTLSNIIINTPHPTSAFTSPSRPRRQLHISTKPTHHLMTILESPSAERNKHPIYDTVLSPLLLPPLLTTTATSNKSLKVLELAAGCGVHTVHFTHSIINEYSNDVKLEWIPSDPDEAARTSIDERVQLAGLGHVVQKANGWILGCQGGTACNDGVRDVVAAGGDTYGGSIAAGTTTTAADKDKSYSSCHEYFDLVLCINMIHIAPWEATLGLMECAGQVLSSGGRLMCYGPYKVNGEAVESNLKFDASLKSKDPSWGIRDLEQVIAVANDNGLEFEQTVEMPANNLSVIFCKR